MIGDALRWLAAEGVDDVSVATQARNTAGLSLYQKSGFAVRSIDCGFHKWFPAHERAAGAIIPLTSSFQSQ